MWPLTKWYFCENFSISALPHIRILHNLLLFIPCLTVDCLPVRVNHRVITKIILFLTRAPKVHKTGFSGVKIDFHAIFADFMLCFWAECWTLTSSACQPYNFCADIGLQALTARLLQTINCITRSQSSFSDKRRAYLSFHCKTSQQELSPIAVLSADDARPDASFRFWFENRWSSWIIDSALKIMSKKLARTVL